MAKGKKSDSKHTAHKSTGGKAPRKELGTGQRPSAESEGVRPLRKRKAASTVTAGEADASEAEEGVLTFEDFAKTPLGTTWCRGCNDDTDARKLTCDKCQHIVCYGKQDSGACLELTIGFFNNPTWSRFICPGCEYQEKKKGTSGGRFAYSGFYDNDNLPIANVIVGIRNRDYNFFRAMRLEKVAIVQIEVEGSSTDFAIPFNAAVLRATSFSAGVVSVDDVLSHRLSSPHVGNTSSPQPLLTSKIVFDLDYVKTQERYSSDISRLRNAVDAMGINEILFFVVTHSDPDSGDLHYTGEGKGAETLKVVVAKLFSAMFQEWLRAKRTYLHFLVCGAKPLMEEGFHYMKSLVSSGVFNDVFLFPTVDLQPAEIAPFSTNLVKFALYNSEVMNAAIELSLAGLTDVGFHTRIIHLSSGSTPSNVQRCWANRYVWSQYSRRPWGIEAPTYCTQCGGIKTFDAKPVEEETVTEEVVFACNGLQGAVCTKEVRVRLTKWEKGLKQGSQEKWGLWQRHKFCWDEELMKRV
ncbi:hypothetical protein VKT23_009681 [Stygiomarasmius scandens]|uniref:Zinc finger PHD-type domain-containing protein n=1 Tax=Marasmiellus scandens TaxID=2682957 RepID=A0ABR1IMY2_9AGAR